MLFKRRQGDSNLSQEKENRFDGLMKSVSHKKKDRSETANGDKSTSKHLNIQTSKSKSTNPDYIRTTFYLPKKIHKQLKAIALEEETEMSSIVEELIATWLSSRNRD